MPIQQYNINRLFMQSLPKSKFGHGTLLADGGLISVFFGKGRSLHLFLSPVFLTDFNKVRHRANSCRSPPCESDKPTK